MNHCKTIAIVNQKGGVGKTTSTVNLGVGLAQAGNRVLLVDDDPQHSLTISLGIRNADDDLDAGAAAATMVWSYIGELIFNMLILVGSVKTADRVVREMMGL